MDNYGNYDNNNRGNFREENFRDGGDKTQLFIAKGRNDGMDSRSLVDFVSSETQIDPNEISNVKVLDDFSFFAVSHEDAEMILDFFQEKAGDGRPLVSKAKRKKPSGDNGGGGYRNNNNNRNNNDRNGNNNDRNGNGRRDYGGNRDYGNSNGRRDYGNRNDN